MLSRMETPNAARWISRQVSTENEPPTREAVLAKEGTVKKRPAKPHVLPPVRMSLDELESIRQSAKEADLTVSEFTRRRVTFRPVVSSQEAKLDAQLISELNRLSVALRSGVGNNFNQILKSWNTDRTTRHDLEATHEQLKDTLQDLHILIGKIAEAYE